MKDVRKTGLTAEGDRFRKQSGPRWRHEVFRRQEFGFVDLHGLNVALEQCCV